MAAVTRGVPKPLLQVGGRALILGVLDRIGTAVTQVCVVVPPGDSRIVEAIRSDERSVQVVEQHERLGVGHAVLQAAGVVSGPMLVVMADAFYSRSLVPFVHAWQASGADGAVLVESPDTPGSAVMGRVRAQDGRVLELAKTGPDPRFDWRVAGAFILPPATLEVLAYAKAQHTGEIEIEGAVTTLLGQGRSFAAIPYDGWRVNVNRPEDLDRIQTRLLDGAAGYAGQ